MYEPGVARDLSPAAIRRTACEAAFGSALVTNNFRGLVAEAIVASALPAGWTWCSADYAAWDFERPDGLRLEVKQSASRQTWAPAGARPSACSFDIRERVGRYEGSEWFAQPGRHAHIYVFGHHPVMDETANHCDALQWQFFVVPTADLPGWKRIGLTNLMRLTHPCSIYELGDEVEKVAAGITLPGE